LEQLQQQVLEVQQRSLKERLELLRQQGLLVLLIK
jgi:hypothetical protein